MDPTRTSTAPALLTIRADSGFTHTDPRWLEEVEQLHEELREVLKRENATLYERAVPAAGQKGEVVEIILALGTSGALGVALTAFRAWLERDKRRSIKLELKTSEGVTGFSVEGSDVDGETLENLARAAMRHVTRA